MILSQYDDRFRLMRKYVKSYIGTRAAIAPHAGVQEMETRYFLARTLENPSSVIDQIRQYELSLLTCHRSYVPMIEFSLDPPAPHS